MCAHGGSSFPRVITPFRQGCRVSRAPSQSLVPRSGSSFLVPDPRSSFRILVPRSGSSFLVPDLTYRFITIVIQHPQQMVQMAFCDLSHTFHKQVTKVYQHVFVIPLWGILTSPLSYISCVTPVFLTPVFPPNFCVKTCVN